MDLHYKKKSVWVYLIISLLLISSCGGDSVRVASLPNQGDDIGGDSARVASPPNQGDDVKKCSPLDYSDPATSEYILPYQVGMTFLVNRGNCRGVSHQPVCVAGSFQCGDLRYGYDFEMTIGMVVLTARGGTVVQIKDQFSNETTLVLEANLVVIEHSDGTFGRYLHLSPDSMMINLGDVVSQGDPIGLSGSSGFAGVNNLHLHFDVIQNDSSTCTQRQTTVDANGGKIIESGCKSVPVTFRNAQPLDKPLLQGKVYTALVF